MPTRVKKKLIQTTTAVSVGCGCRRRLNLSNIFHPKPKSHRYYPPNDVVHSSTTTSSWSTTTTTATATTTATLSSDTSNSPTYYEEKGSKAVQGFGWIGGNSLAVEKDSSDPYVDFRDSMLQMIMEKEIFGKDDLRELLNCFLQLNSPYYHGIIVRAFTEIWTGLPK